MEAPTAGYGDAPAEPMTVEQFADLLAAWHVRKFGERPVSLPATYRKFCEEVGELGEALIRGDIGQVREEAADCMIVLFHIMRGAEGDAADELRRKAGVIDQRLVTGRK
jgi:NTP pyrophosphatase (non-canonical NTP hydrolase)